MTTPAERLDSISNTRLSQIPRSWHLVIPDDSPPTALDQLGNTGEACVGIYCSEEGWVRFVSRGQQLGVRQRVGAFPLVWNDNAGGVNHGLYLELGGMNYELILGLSVPDSVRVWAERGSYIWGELVHIMSHDTTCPTIHALRSV